MKQRLLELRVRHDLSIDDIAVIVGVSKDTVKSWLYRRDYQPPENLIRLLELELQRGKE